MTFESLLLAFILWKDPMLKHASTEDPIQRLERMKSIASDMAEVCSDKAEDPIFVGKNARIKTCLLIASVAYNESGFKKSIDLGEEGGDGGKSLCIMQVQTGQNGILKYTKEQLRDRKTCLRAGLKALRLHQCKDSEDPLKMLRGYVSGTCQTNPDPTKEKAIKLAAANDAGSYVDFMKKYAILLDKVEDPNITES